MSRCLGRGGVGVGDVNRVEKYLEVSVRGSELTATRGIQAVAVGHIGEVSVAVRLPAHTHSLCTSLGTSVLDGRQQ